MKNIKLSAALLALAGTAVLGSGANADVQTTYSNNDLLLGVYDSTGTVTNSYEVDLGQFSVFAAATSPITFNLSSDLASVFTSKGTSLGSLQYAVAGSTNAPTFTLYVTNKEQTPGTHEALIESTSNSTPNKNFIAEANQFRASGETTPTGFFPDSTVVPNGNTGSFFTTVHASSGSYGFSNKVPSGPQGVLNSFDTANATFVSDLDEVPQSGDSTFIGTFEFSNTGILTFDPFVMTTNVPEPSTYALVVCGGAFLLWVLKRRQVRV